MLVTEARKLHDSKGFQTSNYWKEDNNVEVVVVSGRKMTTTRQSVALIRRIKCRSLKNQQERPKCWVTEERKLQNSNYWKEDNNVEVVVRKMTTTRQS